VAPVSTPIRLLVAALAPVVHPHFIPLVSAAFVIFKIISTSYMVEFASVADVSPVIVVSVAGPLKFSHQSSRPLVLF